jgi:hypothetical protein
MSSAILFYGYNLGAPDDEGWAIKDEPDFEEPWFTWAQEADEDYAEAMVRRLLESTGWEGDELPDKAADLVARRCHVRVITCGHSNSLFYGLALEDTVHEADDWTPKCVSPVTSCATPGPLTKALEALGMKPVQVNPSWILAPQEY